MVQKFDLGMENEDDQENKGKPQLFETFEREQTFSLTLNNGENEAAL